MNALFDLAHAAAVHSGVQWLYTFLLQSTVFLLVIALVDRLLQSRVHPAERHRYLVVSLLITPFLPWISQLIAPIHRLLPTVQPDILPILQMPATQITSEIQPSNIASNAEPVFYVLETITEQQAMMSVTDLIPLLVLLVYTIGVSLMAIRLIHGLVRINYFVREATQLEITTLGGWTSSLSVPHRVRLKTSDSVPSPLLAGWIRPAILVPHSLITNGTEQEIRFAIEHELAHFRRGDTFTKLLLTILKTVCWPQAMIWLLTRRVTLLAEQTCDTQVIRKYSSPLPYAEFLARVGSHHSLFGAEAALSHHSSQLLPRIKHLLHTRRPMMSTKHSIFLMSSVLVILVASTALLANPVSDNSREYTKPPAAPAANAIPAQLDEPDETAAPAEPAPAALPEDTGKYYISVETDTTDGDSIHIWYTVNGERIDSLANRDILMYSGEGESVIHLVRGNIEGEVFVIHEMSGDTLGDSSLSRVVVSLVDSLGSGIIRAYVDGDTITGESMRMQLRADRIISRPVIIREPRPGRDSTITVDGDTIYLRAVREDERKRRAVK